MTTDPWVRTYSNPLRLFVRAFGLVWITLLFGVLLGGVLRAGGLATVLLAVLLLPPAGYGYYRLCRVLWRLTDFGLFHSPAGVKVVYGRSVVIPWEEIARFEGRPGLGSFGMLSPGHVLCVVRKDGGVVRTQLSGGRPLTLFGRGTYERTLRVLEERLSRYGHGAGEPAVPPA